jgi:hypothetical protein
VLSEAENVMSFKFLVIILIIYLSTQVSARLSPYLDSIYYKGESGLCLIFGLIVGFIVQYFMSIKEVKDALYSQAIVFKLLLVPLIMYDKAFNVKHFHPGNFSNVVIAIITSFFVGFSLALFFYFLPTEHFGIEMPFVECLMLGLSLATVDTDRTCVEMSMTMSLFVNLFVLMLIQYLSNPGEYHNQGSPTQISVMIM